MAKQTLWEGMISGKPSRLVEEDDVVTIEVMTEGLLTAIASKAFGFAKAHPFITTLTGLYAADAWKKYKDKINKTVKFYAKDKSEKKGMEPVVAQMTKHGYKIVHQAYKGSDGYEWELVQK